MAAPAWAASYSFDVIYLGAGLASLAPGSTDPREVTVLPGDSFDWAIRAEPGHLWTVLNGGSVFPLMAFGVTESAERIGDHTLTLTKQGAPVLTRFEPASKQGTHHMGTNTITIDTGMAFDRMHLRYTLNSATHAGGTVGSTPLDILPTFGMPDQASFFNRSVTVYAPVPEPGTWALWLAGLGVAGALARRRKAA
ncbi:MAG: PEP-CTERM sorting domain-containing protein [Aquabacterium sp.]|nr:PEP-CTERM sorting domain-containing protein [Aquabacterium sp.]